MIWYDSRHMIDRAGDGDKTDGVALLRGRGGSAYGFNQCEPVFGACAALYRTDMFADIRFFDKIFLLYEDVDLRFRAQLRGYQCLYVPDVIVYHKVSQTAARN